MAARRIYSAGECPLGCAGPGLVIVRGHSHEHVLVHCPDCEAAWRSPTDAESQADHTLADFEVDRAVPAALKEIVAAGAANWILSEFPLTAQPARAQRPPGG